LLASIPLSTPPAGIDHPSLPHVPTDDQLVYSSLASGCRGADSRTGPCGASAAQGQPRPAAELPSDCRGGRRAAPLPQDRGPLGQGAKLPCMRTLGGHRRSPRPRSATSWSSSGRNRLRIRASTGEACAASRPGQPTVSSAHITGEWQPTVVRYAAKPSAATGSLRAGPDVDPTGSGPPAAPSVMARPAG
jgi:hypothetical protein